MSRHPVSVGGRADAATYRQELLGRLGLRADASDQDVESAHNGLVEFLELAPREVKPWAETQTADVDEAFALLSGPEKDLVPPTALAAMAPVDLDKTSPVVAPAAPAQPSVPAQLAAPAAPVPPAPAASRLPFGLAGNKPLQKKIAVAAAAVLVVGVGFGVYFNKGSGVPGISGTPTGQQSQASGASTAPPLDNAKVAALMKKISANPKDTASLLGLGDAYFAASDYKNASLWEQKVLALDPKNQAALLSLGAAFYNQGNMADAQKPWLTAAKLYPKLATVHNNLGFLYMSQTPPDNAKAIVEFNKVIAIDPKSADAKTVLTHLKGLQSAAPTAAPTAK
jgi:cytochrome c-type biogenesis protein CcmH/NrfG